MKSDFYRYPAFSYKAFVAATIVIVLDILSLGVVLVRRWETIAGEVVYLLSIGVLGLLILWWIVLRNQQLLRRLLQGHDTEHPESRSDLTAVLSVTSDIAIRGLFIFSICVAVLLRAAFELSRPH